MLFFYLTTIYLGLHLQVSHGCTLPSFILDGVWQSSDYGLLTINGTTMGPIAIGAYGDFYFECFLQTGTKYVVKSTAVHTILSVDQYFYLCLDMRYQTNDTYIYYLQTSQESAASNQQVKIIAATSTPVSATICDAMQPSQRYNLLIKSGTISTEKVTCPSWISGEFNYTESSGFPDAFATTCTDTSVITSNISSTSPTDVFGASFATMDCLYHTTVGSVNYLSVYSQAPPNIFCIVSEVNGTRLNMLFEPSICPETNTPSTPNKASVYFMDVLASCPVASTSTPVPTTTTTTMAPTTSVGQNRSPASRSALNTLLSLFVLVTAFSQAL